MKDAPTPASQPDQEKKTDSLISRVELKNAFLSHREAFIANEFICHIEERAQASVIINILLLPKERTFHSVCEKFFPEDRQITKQNCLKARIRLLELFPRFLPNILHYCLCFFKCYSKARYRTVVIREFEKALWLVRDDEWFERLKRFLPVEIFLAVKYGSMSKCAPEYPLYWPYQFLLTLADSFDAEYDWGSLDMILRLAMRRELLDGFILPRERFFERMPRDMAVSLIADARQQSEEYRNDIDKFLSGLFAPDRKEFVPRPRKKTPIDGEAIIHFGGDWEAVKKATINGTVTKS